MTVMIARSKVDFFWLLHADMYRRAFKVKITYPFSCMIFSLCRSTNVSILRIDQLKTPLSTFDIGLIRDKDNELSTSRRPCPELPLLCKNLAYILANDRTTTHASLETTHNTPVESISFSSTAPASSHSSPVPAVVPLVRVKKQVAQMDTVLHHIQPWMKRTIAEGEESLERKMLQHT